MVRTRRQAALIASHKHAVVKLPQELLWMIIDDLELNSLKNLRLVNRDLAARCLIPSFLARCTQPRTNLSAPYIRFLAKAASHEVFGPLIKSLTIHATSFAKCDFDDNDDKLVEELATALRAIGTVENLDVSGTDPEEGMYAAYESVPPQPGVGKRKRALGGKQRKRRGLQTYPERASSGFVIVMRAIARSGVGVRNLTVMQMKLRRRCCLQSIDLAHALELIEKDGSDFAAAVAATETLSLHVCTRLNVSGHPLHEDQRTGFRVFRIHFPTEQAAQATAPSNFTGLAGLLMPMKNLRELDIIFYNEMVGSRATPNVADDWYSEMFELVGRQVRLPRLEKLKLFMVPATEAGLCNFLAGSPGLRDVAFSWMRLARGGWRPVFDHLAGMPSLRRLRLMSLTHRRNRYNLLPAADSVTKLEDIEPGGVHPKNSNGYHCERGYHIYRREFGEEEIREGLLLEGRTWRPLKNSPRTYYYTDLIRAKSSKAWSWLEKWSLMQH
ncbi:hypothetical protein CMUS01_11322 [Colletotrichum musicola]|uniref:F-box domain-containing protein n=1 Tax=Colletotrichum musicola TaxID=2175873 RepID=A0A8H6JYK1_9PEZI|nr:hypothetical protein CMUS01_11322 [Colletotrichum musicola]